MGSGCRSPGWWDQWTLLQIGDVCQCMFSSWFTVYLPSWFIPFIPPALQVHVSILSLPGRCPAGWFGVLRCKEKEKKLLAETLGRKGNTSQITLSVLDKDRFESKSCFCAVLWSDLQLLWPCLICFQRVVHWQDNGHENLNRRIPTWFLLAVDGVQWRWTIDCSILRSSIDHNDYRIL